MERLKRLLMDQSKPIVAVGNLHLKQQIQHAIGLSPDFHLHSFFLPATARPILRHSGKRLVILDSHELSRYRTKNPARLKLFKRHACVVVVLKNYEAGDILEALKIADGLIFCEVNLSRTWLIAELAESGYLALPAALSAMLLSKGLRHELLHSLNTSESRVLGLLGRGSSNRMIGELLQLDEGRTKYLIRSVFKKLRLQNRTQAAVFARDVLIGASVNPHGNQGGSLEEQLTPMFSN